MVKVAVIGDGGWGTTLAIHLNRKKCFVCLWSVSAEYAEYLNVYRENKKFLPDVPIPKNIEITSDIAGALENAEYVVLAVPAQYMRSVLQQIKGCEIKNRIFISVAKGIELKSLSRMSEVIAAELPDATMAALSGPSIANEVVNRFPTAVVAAAGDLAVARQVQQLFSSDYLRIYVSRDIIGVELGGALKNIIAIAAGISDGLGFAANTKSALITRGVVEIIRFGQSLGAEKETFQGLSGLGDIIVTCFSRQSRNRWFGEEIGKGRKCNDILHDTEMVVEGVGTSESTYQFSRKIGVELPIITEIYKVLYQNKSPKNAVLALMQRKPKLE
ncbi:MAG: NAD(P)H-dependent glycerol-3-phosphate dehydrogenase [Candidatus Omnitrophota bacterium]